MRATPILRSIVLIGLLGFGTLIGAAAPTSGPSTAPAEIGWKDLFDGKTLAGWKVADYGGRGDPAVEEGLLNLPVGEGLTGVTYKGPPLPKDDYEIAVRAKRIDGGDFFCGLTFPVGESHASLIVGGWGGSVVGISSVDGEDAAHNDTTVNRRFESDRWYDIRVRVGGKKIQAWIDNERVVDLSIAGKRLTVRDDIDLSKPLGIATWRTTAAIKQVRLRTLAPGEALGK